MTEAIWTEAFYRIADKLTDAANAAEKKPIAEALLPIILEGGKLIISLHCRRCAPRQQRTFVRS